MAGQKRLSEMLMRQQMILMGKLVFRPPHDPVRNSIFQSHNLELRPLPGPAKRGRPRTRWAVQVLNMCIRIVGSYDQLLNHWHFRNSSYVAWRSHVRRAT